MTGKEGRGEDEDENEEINEEMEKIKNKKNLEIKIH